MDAQYQCADDTELEGEEVKNEMARQLNAESSSNWG